MKQKLKAAAFSLVLSIAASATLFTLIWLYSYYYYTWKLAVPGGAIGIRI